MTDRPIEYMLVFRRWRHPSPLTVTGPPPEIFTFLDHEKEYMAICGTDVDAYVSLRRDAVYYSVMAARETYYLYGYISAEKVREFRQRWPVWYVDAIPVLSEEEAACVMRLDEIDDEF